MPAGGLTDADPATGEQWEAGQVWGHIAEFIQFWVEQAGDVIDAYQGDPVPFGRTRTDPGRLAGIEQGHRVAIDLLWEEVQADLGDLRSFLTPCRPTGKTPSASIRLSARCRSSASSGNS